MALTLGYFKTMNIIDIIHTFNMLTKIIYCVQRINIQFSFDYKIEELT